MKPEHRTPNLRALACAVTVLSALVASLLVARLSLTSSAEFAGYGIDEISPLHAERASR